jgi:hypothetical protein
MKINRVFLLYMANSDKIITNMNIPSCKNCVYFKPDSFGDFSLLGKCEKIGKKDIISDKISYSYAETNRNDENLCGKDGKYFKEEKNINLKILKHKLIINSPYISAVLYIIFNLFLLVK